MLFLSTMNHISVTLNKFIILSENILNQDENSLKSLCILCDEVSPDIVQNVLMSAIENIWWKENFENPEKEKNVTLVILEPDK